MELEPRSKRLKLALTSETESSMASFESLPVEVVFEVCKSLDCKSILTILTVSKRHHLALLRYSYFWQLLVTKAGFEKDCDEYLNAPVFAEDRDHVREGWSGEPLRCRMPSLLLKSDHLARSGWKKDWMKIFYHGLKMRRNLSTGNPEVWKIELEPDGVNYQVDLVPPGSNGGIETRSLVDYKALSPEEMEEFDERLCNHDYRITFFSDQNHLVAISDANCRKWQLRDKPACLYRVFDIKHQPRHLYSIVKGEYLGDLDKNAKMTVWNGNLIQAVHQSPNDPKDLIVCYSLKSKLSVVGRLSPFIYGSKLSRTELKIGTEGKAVVIGEFGSWICLVVSLPECRILVTVDLGKQFWYGYFPKILKMYRNKVLLGFDVYSFLSVESVYVITTFNLESEIPAHKTFTFNNSMRRVNDILFSDSSNVFMRTTNGAFLTTKKSLFVTESCDVIEEIDLTETEFGSNSFPWAIATRPPYIEERPRGARYAFKPKVDPDASLLGFGISNEDELIKMMINCSDRFTNFSFDRLGNEHDEDFGYVQHIQSEDYLAVLCSDVREMLLVDLRQPKHWCKLPMPADLTGRSWQLSRNQFVATYETIRDSYAILLYKFW